MLPDVPGALDGWIGAGGAQIDGTRVDYTLTNTVATRIRPRQPYDDGPVPVLVTPRLAAAADSSGVLPLQIAGERVSVRVVGTVRRFPGVDGQAVVGDGAALAAVVNLARPGAARVNEVWLALRDPHRATATDNALAAKPFDVLAIESRRALEADATAGPDRSRNADRARRRSDRRSPARAGRDPADRRRRSARRAGGALRSRGSGRIAVAVAPRRAVAGGIRRRRRSARRCAHRSRSRRGRHRSRRPDSARHRGRAAARARSRRARHSRSRPRSTS